MLATEQALDSHKEAWFSEAHRASSCSAKKLSALTTNPRSLRSLDLLFGKPVAPMLVTE